MYRISLLFIATCLFAGCNSGNQKGNEPFSPLPDSPGTKTVTSLPDSLIQGCYSLIKDRDTASLQLDITNGNASGSISYNLFEKDRNDGTFSGEIEGDILTVWYLFRSEGRMSIRQESWKIRPGRLWPAVGEVMVRNDTTMYTDPARLSYDSTRAFVKVACII